MSAHRQCDVCKRKITEENPIVSKLYLAPVKPGEVRSTHSMYTASMDVGLCCVNKAKDFGTWVPRKSRKAYNEQRRLRRAS